MEVAALLALREDGRPRRILAGDRHHQELGEVFVLEVPEERAGAEELLDQVQTLRRMWPSFSFLVRR